MPQRRVAGKADGKGRATKKRGDEVRPLLMMMDSFISISDYLGERGSGVDEEKR